MWGPHGSGANARASVCVARGAGAGRCGQTECGREWAERRRREGCSGPEQRRAAWAAGEGEMGWAEKEVGWAGFFSFFLFLFLTQTNTQLGEFKFKFEFTTSTQTNKLMHQHECNTNN